MLAMDHGLSLWNGMVATILQLVVDHRLPLSAKYQLLIYFEDTSIINYQYKTIHKY